MNKLTRLNALTKSLFRPNVSSVLLRYSTNVDIDKDFYNKLVNKDKIVVFMKGNPEAPRCGFSNAVIQLLNFHGVNSFATVDILEDDKIRTEMKEFSSWPTFPQVYFNGEFIGGTDVMIEMHKNGDLIEELGKLGIRSRLLDGSTSDNTEDKKD